MNVLRSVALADAKIPFIVKATLIGCFYTISQPIGTALAIAELGIAAFRWREREQRLLLLSETNRQLTNENGGLRNANIDQQARIVGLEAASQQVREGIDIYQRQNHGLMRELAELRAEIVNIRENAYTHIAEFNFVSEQRKLMLDQNNVLDLANQKLNKDNQKLQSGIQELNAAIEKLKAEKQNLKVAGKRLGRINIDMDAELSKLKLQQIEFQGSNNLAPVSKIRELDQLNKQLRLDIRGLEEKLTAARTDFQGLGSQIRTLEARHAEILRSSRDRASETIDGLDRRIDSLEGANRELNLNRQQFQSEIERLNGKIQKLEQENNSFQDENSRLQSIIDLQSKELAKKNRELAEGKKQETDVQN